MMRGALDWFAARLGIWALRRMFGECEPPYEVTCAGCDATKLIKILRELK